MADRRDEGANLSSEFSEVGQRQYRLDSDGSGKYRMRNEFIKNKAEPIIAHIRQHLTWIEGEIEAGDFDQAQQYQRQLEPWFYQLKAVIEEQKGA